MDIYALDQNFDTICIIEVYESLIWVDKYNEPGTFELYLPATPDNLQYIKPNNYLKQSESDRLMIIEDISYETDIENGDKIKAVGRSLESILDRRIIWSTTTFSNVAFQTAIQTLLNNAIISPSVADRRIPNFDAFVPSTDTAFNGLVVNHQYTGENLLDVIVELCQEFDVGFKIVLNSEKHFVFSLYFGVNRSYNQSAYPYVVFSKDYDNLLDSSYTETNSALKNVALVVGEARKTVGVKKGLDRRELYVDGSDIQKGSLSSSKYNALLEKKGKAELGENNKRTSCDANCDTVRSYIYNTDFFIGDIVQMDTTFNVGFSAKVTEFTWSANKDGIETYPTFDPIEESIYVGKNKLTMTLDTLKTLNTAGEWTDNVWAYSNIVLTVNLDHDNRVVGITFSGRNALSSNIAFDLGVIQSDVTSLILSGCTGGSSSTYQLAYYDRTAAVQRAVNYNGDTAITITNLSNDNRVRLTFFRNKDFEDVTLYPMVRDVYENDSFEPYIGG
ncbi:MAG: siphovirus ReqiPepy6 Gp37-like family protein [Clostridiales bacterium]|nr:siphovirus ReqiPepy6 Gp37-like family protein [Clostridiales bacterium]